MWYKEDKWPGLTSSTGTQLFLSAIELSLHLGQFAHLWLKHRKVIWFLKLYIVGTTMLKYTWTDNDIKKQILSILRKSLPRTRRSQAAPRSSLPFSFAPVSSSPLYQYDLERCRRRCHSSPHLPNSFFCVYGTLNRKDTKGQCEIWLESHTVNAIN